MCCARGGAGGGGSVLKGSPALLEPRQNMSDCSETRLLRTFLVRVNKTEQLILHGDEDGGRWMKMAEDG